MTIYNHRGGMEGDKGESFDPDRFSYARIKRDLTSQCEILNIAAPTSKKMEVDLDE